MINFIIFLIGLMIGGFSGFVICSLMIANDTDKEI